MNVIHLKPVYTDCKLSSVSKRENLRSYLASSPPKIGQKWKK